MYFTKWLNPVVFRSYDIEYLGDMVSLGFSWHAWNPRMTGATTLGIVSTVRLNKPRGSVLAQPNGSVGPFSSPGPRTRGWRSTPSSRASWTTSPWKGRAGAWCGVAGVALICLVHNLADRGVFVSSILLEALRLHKQISQTYFQSELCRSAMGNVQVGNAWPRLCNHR